MLSRIAMRALEYAYHSLLKDIEIYHGFDMRKSRSTFFKRCQAEGFPFISQSLPALGRSFDRALAGGEFARPANFAQYGPHDLRPKLFHELFELIFDENCSMLKKPSIAAVGDIRQLCGLVYKYEVPFGSDTAEKAWKEYRELDAELQHFRISKTYASKEFRPVFHLARTLLTELLAPLDPRSGIPGHGPGAVFEGIDNWDKSCFTHIPNNSLLSYHGWAYYYTNEADIQRSFGRNGRRGFTCNTELGGDYSRFAVVPKDSRGPRMISLEPVAVQYAQQALKNLIYDHVEKHPLTRGHVNFRDQEMNRNLALWGSLIERDIVTLDMKDASRRVTWRLVRTLFPPAWVEALGATRTKGTVFKREDGSQDTFRLHMFAPMGSATCFPVESLVFWSLAVALLTLGYGLDLDEVLKGVYVYGDDIVLRGLPYKGILYSFPRFGLKFNEGKCCTGGYFRESCGMDAFRGAEVQPLRIKQPVPTTRKEASAIVAWIDYSNHAFNRGYYHLSQALQDVVENVYVAPYVRHNADVPGYVSARKNGWIPAEWGSRARQSVVKTRLPRFNKHSHCIEYPCSGTESKRHRVDTDWCRYREELLFFATRKETDQRVTVRITLDGKGNTRCDPTSVPTHRYSLYLADKWSADVVSP